MSVMSAAEARQAAGASPEIPSQPLRIVRPAAGEDDPAEPGYLLDSGDNTSAEPVVTDRSTSTVRVTQVRTVRQVRVSTLRAEGARSGIVPEPRDAGPAGATVPRTGTPARARTASQARVVAETQVAAHARVSGQTGTAGLGQAVTQSLVTSHARVTRQARVTGQAQAVGRAQVVGRAQGAQRPGPVRLTKRGRRVVAALVIGMVIVAATVLWMSLAGSVQASSNGASAGSPYQGMTQVVVRPGQTLWSIAAAAEPSGNSWAVVQQIINVNALSSASVQAGQLLWVPKN